jgi:heme-degrading monooxygenase HmoA
MFVHIWRMRARKKRSKDYETFGRQVTLAALKKIDGCQEAHFLKVFESRKPEYLWVVFWRDQKALDTARTSSAWREQIRKFEAGKFYKTLPLQWVCECLGSFSASPARKPKTSAAPEKTKERAGGVIPSPAGSATLRPAAPALPAANRPSGPRP